MITSNQELQDKIKQLVDVSTALLKWSAVYKRVYEKYKPADALEYNHYANSPFPTLLRFQSSMMFFDVLLNLNSLLCTIQKDPNKKEVSFFELLELLTSSTEKDQILIVLNDASKKFQDNKLDKFRNKFIGHKDLSINYDPVILYLNFPNPTLVKVCDEIIDSLNKICLQFFDCYRNNAFNQLYDNSHLAFIELLENSLSGKYDQ